MIWTTDRPTKPGRWWHRRRGGPTEVVEVVLCKSLWACMETPELVEEMHGEWSSEPIPEPTEPKEPA